MLLTLKDHLPLADQYRTLETLCSLEAARFALHRQAFDRRAALTKQEL